VINKINKAYLLLLAVVMTVFFGNFSSFAAVTAGNWELIDGNWKFYDESHNEVRGWINTENGSYYIDPDNGMMVTGWKNIEDKWYYFNSVPSNPKFGEMLRGWQYIDGEYYYLDSVSPKRLQRNSGNSGGSSHSAKSGTKSSDNKNTKPVQPDKKPEKVNPETGKEEIKENLPEKNTEQVIPDKAVEPEIPKNEDINKPEDKVDTDTTKKENSDTASESEKKNEKEQTGNDDTVVIRPDNSGELVDGEWYGTATWSRYSIQRGPNVVKVTIKDGKIEKVDSVVYTDDDKQAGSYEIKRDRILKMLEGLNSTKEIAKQLQNSTGEAYDAVSGATETAKGHVSAVENALERSRKFKKEGKKSDIDYIEFVKRPDGVAKGKTLDLTHTVLRLHMSGETKDINFDEFVNYGIVADPANGTELPKEGEFRRVTFRQNAALIKLETDIQTEKKITKKYASHILVNYESGETKKIELSNDEYRYKIEAAGKIVGMSIFDGENKLTDGVYDSHISQWQFNLKNISHEGYNFWGFETYAVVVDSSKDSSDIASFEIISDNVKKNFYVGDVLNLDEIAIKAVTKNGNNKTFTTFEVVRENKFSFSPDNKYIFTTADIGTKKISVSREIDGKTVTENFDVNVSDPHNDAPAKIEIYDKDKLVVAKNIGFEEFTNNSGYMRFYNTEIPKKYEGKWDKDTFTVKVYNASGNLLNSNVKKRTALLNVELPDYMALHGSGGYIMFSFKYVDNEPKTEPKTDSKPEPKTEVVDIVSENTPSTVELYDGSELLKKETITREQFENSNAHYMIYDVTIPKKYENWTKSTFNVKVLNSKGGEIENTINKSDNILGINLTKYKSPRYGKGYVGLRLKYKDEIVTKTVTASAPVDLYDYDARVKVVYNAKTGEIISVEDDDTYSGSNQPFWRKAQKIFEKLVGKKKSEVDGVDAISYATLSSNAIKAAVKKALSE
jgi:putative uncharacterized protein (fragment)